MTVIHEKDQTLMTESEKRIHRQEFEKYETVLSGISKTEHSVYRIKLVSLSAADACRG